MSEIRYDALYDSYTIIAPNRLRRSDITLFAHDRSSTHSTCAFCAGNESLTPPEIYARRSGTKDDSTWHTRVVPNLYKALQIEANNTHHYGAFEYIEGFGAHEVVIDTPKHITTMRDFTHEMISAWLWTLRVRLDDLRKDTRIAYISIFKNEGKHAGATQEHAHTQIVGLPIIPPYIRAQYERMHAHFKTHNKALQEVMIQHELDQKSRIIKQIDEFVLYAPYASRFAFEVAISSARPIGTFSTIRERCMKIISSLLEEALTLLAKQLGAFEYNLFIDTPPLNSEHIDASIVNDSVHSTRFSMRIIPKIYNMGGFEHSSAMYINPLAPEEAAKLLRGGL